MVRALSTLCLDVGTNLELKPKKAVAERQAQRA